MSFRMKETDRAFFVLTIDDANRFLGRIYDICHEYGVPLCPAIIPWNLDNVYDDPEKRSAREICRLFVKDGGEIISHSGKFLTKDSTDEDYDEVFRKTKEALISEGFSVRGIITAGGPGYLDDDPKLLEWSRRYYDYSDRNGVRGEPQYWNPRYWPGDYTLEENLRNIDGFVRDKKFVVFAMHGSDDPESCECPEKFREIIRHIVSLTIDKAVITTWADVFDRFWGVSD